MTAKSVTDVCIDKKFTYMIKAFLRTAKYATTTEHRRSVLRAATGLIRTLVSDEACLRTLAFTFSQDDRDIG